jgi:hypothetical protein
VCAAPASLCKPAPGTPLYANPPALATDGTNFQQAKFGGDGWLGPETSLFDGYSGVLTWPGQGDVLVDEKTYVSAWLGFDLEGGFFIQSGYGGFHADGFDKPCSGKVWVEIFRFGDQGAELIDDAFSEAGTFCKEGEKVQFKAERDGSSWVFSFRAVGPGRSADFTVQSRHDFGLVAHAKGHVMAYTEMYDYHDAVEKLQPITFGPVLVKADSWKPVERMTNADDFGSERILVRPEPAIAGVTTSAPGEKCFGPAPGGGGQVMWDSTSACWAASVHCDANTSACE